MTFWRPAKTKKKEPRPPDSGQVVRVTKKRKKYNRSTPISFEAKVLALEALNCGADREDVAQVLGVKPTTLYKWMKLHHDEGIAGLCRKPSSITVRKQCTELEKRIVAHRTDNPDHGVRRIRDELRNHEGLEVSAEKIRQTVNEAGVGNPPPRSHKRPPKVRRFERPTPNAMWQIDIFTFNLKRMYKVYLIGIIDDHSRYLVGWGLYRQQTAEAVMEVVKGAIGQWGAPREILSDNGRQFVAWRGKTQFQKTLKQQGIQHVRSAPHHPMTLGKIERFWQTIWREFLEEAVFASFADACQRLDHWVGYYNHQRPHQGIDGACPADRFYGMAKDVEAAVKQGCRENSLRLALGQEPQPPLYLLGQLGGVDVRVVRKGDDIEVKVGETVHEVIHLADPYAIGEDGHGSRETAEVEGSGRNPEVQGGGASEETGNLGDGSLPDVWGQSSDLVPGDGSYGQGVDRCVDCEAEGAPAYPGYGEGPTSPSCPEQATGVGSEAGEAEEPGGPGAAGTSPESGTAAVFVERKKNRPQARSRFPGWL
jgi:transposase InsO family protein